MDKQKVYIVVFEIFLKADDEDDAKGKSAMYVRKDPEAFIVATREIEEGTQSITIVQEVSLGKGLVI